jgi:hypothetical protein
MIALGRTRFRLVFILLTVGALLTVATSSQVRALQNSNPEQVKVVQHLQINLNDTKDAFLGIVNLNGHTRAILHVWVNDVDVPGNMACRGDLGSAATDTWRFGVVDCHFDVPGSLRMEISSINEPNLRLAVSGGGPTQPTWATGLATISASLLLV